MLVLNIKYVLFSFPFIHFPICSNDLISMMTSIECCREKIFIVHLLAKCKIFLKEIVF